MPIIQSNYTAPGIFRNPHFSTIFSATWRTVDFPVDFRQRLELPDGDFLDLDRNKSITGKAGRILLLMHGLTGNANRPYVRGMARTFSKKGWDIAAVNFRSCSGEMNRKYRSYNAGATEDLQVVIDYLLREDRYEQIGLIGFSLGGNLLLKYLGESKQLPAEIFGAVAVSTPCDLRESLGQLARKRNYLYSRRFLHNLKKELFKRQKAFPGKLEKKQIASCRSLLAIDELYTSKAHGYENAAAYYQQCSCLQFLPDIQIPTLLLNARNDSFIGQRSFPEGIARRSKHLYLETPSHGGHLGFFNREGNYYHENRAVDFLTEQLNF